MKTIVIGDIHGCSGALRTLLAGIFPDPEKDRLILLGDLFDRGPDSWGVFQIVRELADQFGDRFVLLRGNHEDYLLQPKLSFQQKMVWERVGRKATVRSFKSHGEKMENTIPWISEHASMFYRDQGGDFQCVHAGLLIEPIEANDYYTMIHDHYVAEKNCYGGPLTIVGHIALEKPTWFAGDGKTIVKLEEGVLYDLPEKGVICIDAGCGKVGRLLGMTIEDGKYVLSGVSETG